MLRAFRTPFYDAQFKKLNTSDQQRIANIEQSLKRHPAGKQLGYPFFREKRMNDKRVLYLVYEQEQLVLLVMITDKRRQQQDIEQVQQKLNE